MRGSILYLPGDVVPLARVPDGTGAGVENLGCPDVTSSELCRCSTHSGGGSDESGNDSRELHDDG